MKRSVPTLCLACALVWGGVRVDAVGAEDALPRPAAADRYAKMADRSPFAPPTAPPSAGPGPTPLPAGPKWSDDLVVTLLTQQGGVYFATIQDKVKNDHFLLQTNKEDTERHLALASVQWGELVDQTTVTLRHNGEFASVRFDPNSTPGTRRPRHSGRPPATQTWARAGARVLSGRSGHPRVRPFTTAAESSRRAECPASPELDSDHADRDVPAQLATGRGARRSLMRDGRGRCAPMQDTGYRRGKGMYHQTCLSSFGSVTLRSG